MDSLPHRTDLTALVSRWAGEWIGALDHEASIHLDDLLGISKEVARSREAIMLVLASLPAGLDNLLRASEYGLLLPLRSSPRPRVVPLHGRLFQALDRFEPPSVYVMPISGERYWPFEEYRLSLADWVAQEAPTFSWVYTASRSRDELADRDPYYRVIRAYRRTQPLYGGSTAQGPPSTGST